MVEINLHICYPQTYMKINKKTKSKSEDRVIIHYTHETRFNSMKRDMHEVFREAFKNFGIEGLKLIVGHRKSPPLKQELIRKTTQQNPDDHAEHMQQPST